MNRREAVVAGAAGAATGTLWAGGFGLLLHRGAPTLEVIGRGDDLAALLDTGSFRVLIVAGEGRSDRIRSLLGLFRRRIDLLLGSEQGISAIGTRAISRLHVARTFVLDAPVGARTYSSVTATATKAATTSTASTGPAALRAALPGGMTLEIATYPAGAWQQDDPVNQTWVVILTRGAHRCAIAPSLDVISTHSGNGLALGIGSDGNADRIWDMSRVPVVAVNSDRVPSSAASETATRMLRIFPNDPLTFTFTPGGITASE